MSNVPIAVGWKVIVKPRAAKTETDSGLDMSATADAQEHLVYIGELVAVGEAAFMTKTAGGLDMSKWKVRPQVGDWVLFSPYAGLQIRQSGSDGLPLRLINDTDVHALIENPDDFFCWVDV